MVKKVKYDRVISIALSEAQEKKLKKKSEKFNFNVSAVIRELLDKSK